MMPDWQARAIKGKKSRESKRSFAILALVIAVMAPASVSQVPVGAVTAGFRIIPGSDQGIARPDAASDSIIIKSSDTREMRPGTCAALAVQSPLFQEFQRLNPLLRPLSLDDKLTAFAFSGARAALGRLQSLKNPGGDKKPDGEAAALAVLQQGLDNALVWIKEREDEWVLQDKDGSELNSTPSSVGSQSGPGKIENHVLTRREVIRAGLVSPSRREIEIMVDLGIAQYLVASGNAPVAAERANQIRDRLMRESPDSPLLLAVDLLLVDAYRLDHETALALDASESFDENLARFPRLFGKINHAEIKTAAFRATIYRERKQSGLGLPEGRSEEEELKRVTELYSGGGNLLHLVFPGGAGLITYDRPPAPESVLRTFAPASSASILTIGQAVLLAVQTDSVFGASVPSPPAKSLAELARWTLECGELGAQAFLAGDFALASAAGNTAFRHLDGPMAKALVSLGVSEGAEGYEELFEDLQDWYLSRPGKTYDHLNISLIGLGSIALPVLSGDTGPFLGAIRRVLGDDVIRHAWKETRGFVAEEVIVDTGLTMQDIDPAADQAIATASAARDAILSLLEPSRQSRNSAALYFELDRFRTRLSRLINMTSTLFDRVFQYQGKQTDDPDEINEIKAIRREIPFLRKATIQYVDILFANGEAMLAARSGEKGRLNAAIQKSQRLARSFATALGGSVTSTDPGMIVKQAALVATKYGLELSRRVENGLASETAALAKDQIDGIKFSVDLAVGFLIPLPYSNSPEARAIAQDYKDGIRSIMASLDPDWAVDLRDSFEPPDLSDQGSFSDFAYTSLTSIYSQGIEIFLARGYWALSELNNIGAKEEVAFLLEGLQAVTEGVSEWGDASSSFYTALGVLDDAVFLSLIQIGSQFQRPVITETALSLWVAAKRAGKSTNANQDTQDFRADRNAFAIQAWVVAQRIMSGQATGKNADLLLNSLDFANRSAAGVDFSIQLEMQAAPKEVRDAYQRWRRLSLDLEADGDARRASAQQAFQLGRALSEWRPVTGATASTVSDAYRNLIIAAQNSNYGLPQFRTTNFAELQAALDDREVLITGMVYASELLAVAIRRGKPIRVARVDRSFADLTAKSAQLRASMTLLPGREAPDFNLDASRVLYQSLFAFADEFIDGADRIIWSPPRGLDNFPVAVLDRAQSGDVRWLGLEKEIMVAPSLASLVSLRAAVPFVSSGAIAAVGDVPFVGPTTSGLGSGNGLRSGKRPNHTAGAPGISNLNYFLGATPAARQALASLKSLFPQSELLDGANATRINVTSKLRDRSFDYLLFHTHGVGEDVTLACGYGVAQALALNHDNPDKPCKEALLGAQDAAQLGIRARVVMLGACSTSAAPNRRLDPVGGMARGFLLGGARAVVSAHLPVSDRAASLVGKELATGLLTRKRVPTAALRDAMMLVRSQRGMSGPAYWGQFEIIGEGGR